MFAGLLLSKQSHMAQGEEPEEQQCIFHFWPVGEPQKLHRVHLSNMSLLLENIRRMMEYSSGFILLRCIASQKVNSVIEDMKKC